MNKMIKSPNRIMARPSEIYIFMGGSIEMGTAVDWQTELFEKTKARNITYLNPRRDDWDFSWVQRIDNPQFNEQVNWELNGLLESDYQVFVFDPKTISPITLMELGFCIKNDRVLGVVCPEEYFRKGNVDIICSRYDVPVFETVDDLASYINKVLAHR